MLIRKLLFFCLFFLQARLANAQCTTLGQTPATAFPVCGSATFTQSSVPPCKNGSIPVTCSSSTGNSYEDLNPYWYKFTCFAAGTLKLTISPKDNSDDYDWQIFDVTGHDPSDVYSNLSLLVACNWSGLPGVTGTLSTASSLNECGSYGTGNPPRVVNPPKYSKLPDLVQGHKYLLMISHFSGDAQSGYDLSFTGGTASITDMLPPALKSVDPICDGSRIRVVLNKKMQCRSLEAGGSDFVISPAAANVIAVKGNGCTGGFDLDTVELTMSGPLPIGSYMLMAKTGSDGNSLMDNCDVQVPDGSSLPFELKAPQPTPFDSLTPPSCAPSVLEFVFRKRIRCSSVAANGSDFKVTGTTPVTVVAAGGDCDADGTTAVIRVQLSQPILTAGNYTITLAPGVDGNTVIDECGQATPIGATIDFSTKDTVSAKRFTGDVLLGCKQDTIIYHYPDINGVDSWVWVFDGADTSLLQDPPGRVYAVFDAKAIKLTVSNGFCSDSIDTTVALPNAMNAAFEAPNIICPEDRAEVKDQSIGNILSWTWDYGDGVGDLTRTPAGHVYAKTGIETKYPVRLITENWLGCKDTAIRIIDVLRSCYIAVPTAFTPNGDGMNDYLYPLNAFKADNLQFRVFSRLGQLVFTSTNWLQKWDGTINGHAQPTGTYVWMLQYTDRDTGRSIFQKGTSVLIR